MATSRVCLLAFQIPNNGNSCAVFTAFGALPTGTNLAQDRPRWVMVISSPRSTASSRRLVWVRSSFADVFMGSLSKHALMKYSLQSTHFTEPGQCPSPPTPAYVAD